MERNLLVYSKDGDPIRPFEFEVTRNQHMKDPAAPNTVTAMFKDPPQNMDAEAWRILRAVVKGKKLLPEIVHQYMQDSLARLAPGSASASASQGAAAAQSGRCGAAAALRDRCARRCQRICQRI